MEERDETVTIIPRAAYAEIEPSQFSELIEKYSK